ASSAWRSRSRTTSSASGARPPTPASPSPTTSARARSRSRSSGPASTPRPTPPRASPPCTQRPPTTRPSPTFSPSSSAPARATPRPLPRARGRTAHSRASPASGSSRSARRSCARSRPTSSRVAHSAAERGLKARARTPFQWTSVPLRWGRSPHAVVPPQELLDEPGVLLVRLHQRREQVVRARVALLVCDARRLAHLADDAALVRERLLEHLARRGLPLRDAHGRPLADLLRRRKRVAAEHPQPLAQRVHLRKGVVRQLVEEQVQVAEQRPVGEPVVALAVEVQRERVRLRVLQARLCAWLCRSDHCRLSVRLCVVGLVPSLPCAHNSGVT